MGLFVKGDDVDGEVVFDMEDHLRHVVFVHDAKSTEGLVIPPEVYPFLVETLEATTPTLTITASSIAGTLVFLFDTFITRAAKAIREKGTTVDLDAANAAEWGLVL